MRAKRNGWRLAAALACIASAAVAARAQGGEALSAGAGQIFWETTVLTAPRFERAPGVLRATFPTPDVGQMVKDHLVEVRLVNVGATRVAAGPAQTINIGPLLNRHFKTDLNFTLGGASLWVSGTFDRAQKAYVSILVDGQAARMFNVEDLVKKPEILDIGSGKYQLKVAPDLSDLLDSEIALINTTNRKDAQRVTLRDMLTSVAAAGESATIGGDAYKVFYYDDVKNGALDPSSRSFAFIKVDKQGQFHVFLVPAELVPTDKIAIFQMHEGKSVGLQLNGGSLLLYQQP